MLDSLITLFVRLSFLLPVSATGGTTISKMAATKCKNSLRKNVFLTLKSTCGQRKLETLSDMQKDGSKFTRAKATFKQLFENV